uniref:Uncharacterized protein n=1 Tax=Anguilla anguilla TaxID=7936 RepID=A0A0E9U9F2_ANGAN
MPNHFCLSRRLEIDKIKKITIIELGPVSHVFPSMMVVCVKCALE